MNAAGGAGRGAVVEERRGAWERDGDVRMGRYGYGDGEFGGDREKSGGLGESIVEKKGAWESWGRDQIV